MHPSYNNINGNTSFCTNNQQKMTSFCYYNHEEPIFKPNNMQSTMEKSSYSNSAVILETNCFKSNRSSKKDRHSKITTARGIRDRRMRLSLDVAKKFFNLQDMLGFDKASSTVEWLLMKSKAAIRDLHHQQLSQSCNLMGVSNSPSSASECEVLSGIDDQLTEKTGEDDKIIIKDSNTVKKKIERVRKSVYIDQALVKETREKARERARKRTSEKRNSKLGCYDSGGCHQYSKLRPSLDQVKDLNTTRFGSWSPFGGNQVPLTDQIEYPSSHFQFKQGLVGESSSMMSSNWSPSFLFNDLQILGKPWEGINN